MAQRDASAEEAVESSIAEAAALKTALAEAQEKLQVGTESQAAALSR
jgi:hypothetical protein